MFKSRACKSIIGVGIKLTIISGALSACGQDPSFTENRMVASNSDASVDPSSKTGKQTGGGSAEDTGTGMGGSSGGGAGGSETTGGGTTGGGTTGGGTTGGGTTGGGTTGGGPTGGGGTPVPVPVPVPVYVPPADYPAGTIKRDVLVEDGGELVVPGVKAIKVGVNFEDLSDFDYNDSVLCFSGSFKVDNRRVTSYKRQTIVAAVTNNSACGHYIHVQVRNKDGVVTQQFKYNDRITTSASINFDVGSTLFVAMENFENSGCIGPIGMNHPDRVQVAPDVCRR